MASSNLQSAFIYINFWKFLTTVVRFMSITWGLLASSLLASFGIGVAKGGKVQGVVSRGDSQRGIWVSWHPGILAQLHCPFFIWDSLAFTFSIPGVFTVPQKAWDWQLMPTFQEESSETVWYCVLSSQILFLQNIRGLVFFFFFFFFNVLEEQCVCTRAEKWNFVISIWSILIEKPWAFAWNSLTLSGPFRSRRWNFKLDTLCVCVHLGMEIAGI